jgi:prevent-host-death family protein
MKTVGVRELRQEASALLRRIESGETIEITDRGRPVAVLAPLTKHSPLERLRAAGDTSGKSRGMSGLGKPLELRPTQEAPSSVLARLRKNER